MPSYDWASDLASTAAAEIMTSIRVKPASASRSGAGCFLMNVTIGSATAGSSKHGQKRSMCNPWYIRRYTTPVRELPASIIIPPPMYTPT